jgi:agmatine deiminase
MPAEWESHAATWLSWPRRNGISFPGIYDLIPPVFAAMVRAISPHELVCINVWDEAMENEARDALREGGALNEHIQFHHFPAYEPWARDHGPVFVVSETSRAVIDWEYNAWGGKYPPFDLDNEIPGHIARLLSLDTFAPDMVLEGGSIDANGCGTLLTTERCLLNKNRNPDLSRGDIEQRLRDFLGVAQILWLGDGIAGDDTDGHVDNLARFVDARTVAVAVEPDPTDENHQPLQNNLARLQSMRDQAGQPLRIVELPLPAPVHHEGERLPASYLNFYVTNGSVLVPTFRDPNDVQVIGILGSLFPNREIIGIDSTDLAWGLGSIHCLTMQEPGPKLSTNMIDQPGNL